MDKQEVIKKLKELKSERCVLGKIEWAVGIPENNLSGYISEKKKMPEKWVTALSEYFESGKHDAKKIELPADYLTIKKIGILKEDGSVELITDFSQIQDESILIGLRAWEAMQLAAIKSNYVGLPPGHKVEIGKYQNDLSKIDPKAGDIQEANKGLHEGVLNSMPKPNTPPMPTRNKGEDSFDFAQRKNEWKQKYNQ